MSVEEVAVAILEDDEQDQWDYDNRGCECEQDWNCHLHKNRVGTWLETRYDHLYDGDDCRY